MFWNKQECGHMAVGVTAAMQFNAAIENNVIPNNSFFILIPFYDVSELLEKQRIDW